MARPLLLLALAALACSGRTFEALPEPAPPSSSPPAMEGRPSIASSKGSAEPTESASIAPPPSAGSHDETPPDPTASGGSMSNAGSPPIEAGSAGQGCSGSSGGSPPTAGSSPGGAAGSAGSAGSGGSAGSLAQAGSAGSAGTGGVPACVPGAASLICPAADYECGELPDGCTGKVACGQCPALWECRYGRCLETCASRGFHCGRYLDLGLDCGSCPNGAACGPQGSCP